MAPGGQGRGCRRVTQKEGSSKNDENVEDPAVVGSRLTETDQDESTRATPEPGRTDKNNDESGIDVTDDHPVRQANGHWGYHRATFHGDRVLEDVFGPVDADPAKGMDHFIWQWGPDEDDAVIMSPNLAQVLRTCVDPSRAMLMFRTAMYCSRYNTAFPTITCATANHYLVAGADGTHFVAQLDVRFALFRDEKGYHAILFSLIAGTDIPVDLTVAVEACRQHEGSTHVTPGLAAVPWHQYFNPHGGRSRYWVDGHTAKNKQGPVVTSSREIQDNRVVFRALDSRLAAAMDDVLLQDDRTTLKLVENSTRRAIELVEHGESIATNTTQTNVYTVEIPSGPDHLIMLDDIIDREDVLEGVYNARINRISSPRQRDGKSVFSRHWITPCLPREFAGPLTMDTFASSRISKRLSLAAFRVAKGGPIAPMEECLARARADWGHDADKMLALATVIQWFHNASSQGKDKSYSNNRYVKRIWRNCRILQRDPSYPSVRSKPRPTLAEEILALRYCAPDGSLDATIAGQLCELGLIHLAQAKAYNYRGNNLVAETTKETSAAAPQAGIAQDQRVAELEDKVQALTAQLETLHKNEQRVPTDGQAVVTEQDLLDAMGQAQVKITNAREEAEAAMDAKLASEVAKLNNGVDEQLAAMQRKITEMEATIRDLKTKGASGLMAGVPARPSKRNAGSVATGDEGRPSKRAHGSRSGFSSERRREDESPDTPSGQKGKASGTKSWFP